jgi:hypothetical protein
VRESLVNPFCDVEPNEEKGTGNPHPHRERGPNPNRSHPKTKILGLNPFAFFVVNNVQARGSWAGTVGSGGSLDLPTPNPLA